MAQTTRLATTVTARYFPSTELTDAFYMDGRLTGKREARSADITTDKEDRGFFMSVFSHATIPGQDPNSLPPYEPALRKLFNDVKSDRKSLDDEIGEMVNTAVSVTGRLKIQAENARAPYFSGVIVKDSEVFAITLGKGLAFLYRDDTLFPMTATDIKIDPVNTQKQKVDHFYNYCATKTATALCSNIAQLHVDDCIILCNREVYDALGQHELLRILYDAEDQCEAAGNVITEASAKMPNVPLQFMISFVEDVASPQKSGFFGFGRKKNQKAREAEMQAPVDDTAVVPEPKTGAQTSDASGKETAGPLFFGSEPTDPSAEPLAEKPVPPAGPDEPLLINDESMEPFGETTPKTKEESEKDGGAESEDANTEKPDENSTPKDLNQEDKSVEKDLDKGASEQEDDRPASEEKATAEAKIPDSEKKEDMSEPATDKDENNELEIGSAVKMAFAEEDEHDIPVVSSDAVKSDPENMTSPVEADEETESKMGNFDFDGKDTPQYIPDDDTEDDAPLLFGDEVVDDSGEEAAYSEEDDAYTDFSEDQIPLADEGMDAVSETAGQADGYYIPFDSVQPPEPVGTAGQDIPEVPLYDAPPYQAQSYFDDEGFGETYDQADAYSRGSFDINEDDDVRQDYPPMPSGSSQVDFSYGMPPVAPPGGNQPPQRGNSRPGGGPNRPQQRPRSGDPFDQERGFDYGDTNRVFKKNNLIMLVLGGVCLVLIIVLIVFAAQSCGDDNNVPVTEPTVQTTPPPETTDATDPTGGTDPVTPTEPGTEPISVFEFSTETGFRTWWDLFYYGYDIKIDGEDDPRIAIIIAYNQLPADYEPKPGEKILLPPSSMIATSD
ncbi:MAG: hypothetical protein JW780_07785 [Clostridiales bacterium]|nr:hypothetical protein [Clostridiales bacterium]